MEKAPDQLEHTARPSSVDAIYMTPAGMSNDGWREVARLLEPGLAAQAEMSVQQALMKVASGRMQLWALMTEDEKVAGAVLTKIHTEESGRRICTLVVGSTVGTNLEWQSMRSAIATMERFGYEHGCDAVQIHGRRGWLKVLKDYSQKYVTLEKKLREDN